MKLLSVNVGLPREVVWKRKTVKTVIFKEPVRDRVMVRAAKLIPLGSPNLDDDEQVDLSAHGGADKAVYGYPSEHYDDWQSELPDTTLTPGNFGESSTESFTRKLA